VPHLDPPSWRAALTVAVVLFAVAALLGRRWRTPAAAAREAGILLVLDAVWQLLGAATHSEVAGASGRGEQVWQVERALHLPSELWLQAQALPHPDLVQAANAYYLYAHLNGMVVVLAFFWWRHRERYALLRLVLVLLTLSSFLVQLLPVAPPRLLPDLGFVDTATLYGQSVYGSFGEGLPGQLLAMPSLHVGWALLGAWVAVRYGGRVWRALALTHAVLTVWVVTVTANHWLMDGIVAGGLLALSVPAAHLLLRARAQVSPPLSEGPLSVPAPTLAA
jgi:PAP2 superfamily